MKQITLFVTALFLVTINGIAQQADPILKIGHKITIQSKILNESRDVWVCLPPNYNDKYFQAAHYPVLYVLDGDAHFQSLAGVIQALASGVNGTLVIPEMIIVAIPNTNRTRDMLPTRSTIGYDGKSHEAYGASGGADNFLNFITSELAPKIESTYRTFPYRVFMGHSFGGVTALHALLTMPQAFNAYVAVDPSLWWDEQKLLQQFKQQLPSSNIRHKTLYVAQANTLDRWDSVHTHFNAIKEFRGILDTQNPSGIRWKSQYYPNDSHSSVAFIAHYDALRFIFEHYTVDMGEINTPAELVAYYEQFSQETGVTFIPPERVVLQLAESALMIGQYPQAQAYFQMNLDLYPQSSAAQANMGNFFKTRGDKAKALSYYEKSLKIFPQNEDSRNNVESLRKELHLKKQGG